MAETISKNARTGGSKTQRFVHECGGEIKMFMKAQGPKLRPTARCEKCGVEGRSPSALMEK